MAKIANDKYYTPKELVRYCVDKTLEVIGKDNITEFIEPSAGSGVFLDYLDELGITYLAYDIEPEDEKNRIVKQDFLNTELEHKKGRCVIGNPPFGKANSKLKRFYKTSLKYSDYIAFIMPISQYKNNYELYDFDLIFSEDLGVNSFSGINKHCCFNIYKKPLYKKSKPKLKMNDIEIVGWRKAKSTECDFYICCYGAGSIGKLVEKDTALCNINGIIVHKKDLKDKISEVLQKTNWCEVYPMTSVPNLLQWQVYKYLKEQIPELK